jgi:DNA gyrase subunit A
MKLNEDRGSLVGGLVVTDNDEVIAIKASGQITRSAVAEVPVKGRDTMGVRFVGVGENDSVVVIALNPETTAEAARLADEAPAGDDSSSTSGVVDEDSSPESGPKVWPVGPDGVSEGAGGQEDDSE